MRQGKKRLAAIFGFYNGEIITNVSHLPYSKVKLVLIDFHLEDPYCTVHITLDQPGRLTAQLQGNQVH